MPRNNEYIFDSRVRFSEVDHTKRMSLPGVINYFQDCSTFQSESLGLGVDHFAAHKRAWILSAWQIEIIRYPKLGEKIRTATWATEFNGFYGLRNFCMTDEKHNQAAYANSTWVYMDMEKGRPAKPTAEEIAAYGTGSPLRMEYESRKILLPKETESGTPFPVRKYHIDTNEHVNNCQYVQMALEFMEEREEIRHLRVEYKKSAVYGDIIYPRKAVEENRIVVELCDGADRPYAVVEFKR